MAEPRAEETLHYLSLLYLALAHAADDYVSGAELQTVVHRLQETVGRDVDPFAVQDSVMEALAVHVDTPDSLRLFDEAMMALRDAHPRERLERFLRDLIDVARADGIILDDERGLLAKLADGWRLQLVDERSELSSQEATGLATVDDVLYDLAYIFLVLGHGADLELSDSEKRMMLQRLEQWQPHLSAEQVRAVLKGAMDRYAAGSGDEALRKSIRSVKEKLPPAQRMAALNDLIKIANADDVFLDDEEDLINRLLTEWEVDPYANYGEHGSKKGDA